MRRAINRASSGIRSNKPLVAKLEEMGAELLGEGSRTIHAHWYAGESRCNNGTHRTNAGSLTGSGFAHIRAGSGWRGYACVRRHRVRLAIHRQVRTAAEGLIVSAITELVGQLR